MPAAHPMSPEMASVRTESCEQSDEAARELIRRAKVELARAKAGAVIDFRANDIDPFIMDGISEDQLLISLVAIAPSYGFRFYFFNRDSCEFCLQKTAS